MSQYTLVHGDILYSDTSDTLACYPDSWMVIRSGLIEAVEPVKPDIEGAKVRDYGHQLILPVFSDLHFHSVQYAMRGLGRDKELLPWLQTYTFKEEACFANIEYAERVFKQLLNELWTEGSFNLCTFSSLHLEATLLLMDMYEANEFRAYVGKVNMDSNDPILVEDTEASFEDTKRWIEESRALKYTKPIITPRFAPSCTPKLLANLGRLVEEQQLPVQTHLNENHGEIELVAELFPDYDNYYDVYRKNGLTPEGKTVMAHCIHNTKPELEAMKEDKVLIAHCPASNVNLSSGIMPLRDMIDQGFLIALGSDIGGGDRLFIGHAIVDAIRSANILSIVHEGKVAPVTFPEAYYLATAGGGSFFGKTGTFKPGYSADYIVVDDSCWPATNRYDLSERLEQFIYAGSGDRITERCMRGNLIAKPYSSL
ncbi:MAG: amidohydrolase family protein [Clostridiaceae bacterium]|nr:amidohydrolase family protein [Clostridiaceae bacterium]